MVDSNYYAVFALAGTLIGMAEETLAYIGILVPIAIALGFDAITGAAIVLVGASVGFMTAVLNPFTVGIAQGLLNYRHFQGLAIVLCCLLLRIWFLFGIFSAML